MKPASGFIPGFIPVSYPLFEHSGFIPGFIPLFQHTGFIPGFIPGFIGG